MDVFTPLVMRGCKVPRRIFDDEIVETGERTVIDLGISLFATQS
jgi:hypothetical protein